MGPSPRKLYAEIVLNRPMRQSYHYRLPAELRESLTIGKRVYVPFGRQEQAVGYCVGFADEVEIPESKLKDVLSVIDDEPLLSPTMLELTRQVAEHYCCSWGETIQAALPAGVRKPASARTIRIVRLLSSREQVAKYVQEHRGHRLDKRARVLRVLAEEIQGDITPFELAGMCAVSRSIIDALRKEGHVDYEERPVDRDPLAGDSEEKQSPIKLNEEQRAALDLILENLRAEQFGVILVQGVTASGKTEIYLQAIDEVARNGQQAIVMVPEIALTPQMVQRFRARFENVAVLHSRQTEAQRREQWQAIREGKAPVVIGARSAVFAPTPNLGFIVVDEEHENSFKQDSTPRYNGRDVAVMRGNLEKATVVLGSATPSLESYHNWRTGKYQRAVLRYRVEERPLPPVHIIDMNAELAGARYWSFLSRPLTVAMGQALEREEQVILFLNRRGFSTHLRCFRCRYQLSCDQCNVALTYYQKRGLAICLHCRKEMEPPELCPACGVGKLRYLGLGTEKIEEEVKKLFPAYPVSRMDSDTMRGHDAYEKQFVSFREGRIRILIGTQMISKGLDLPNVTLVGVVSADSSLHLADFRAFERTFQLVAQVAGRAGRGSKPGKVIVQTLSPEHHAIRMAGQHDFESFAEQEILSREAMQCPPYTRALRILFSGAREQEVEATAEQVGELLRLAAPEGVRLLGPAPCVLSKVRNQFRYQILAFAPRVGMIRYLAQRLDPSIQAYRRVAISLDVDPMNMF